MNILASIKPHIDFLKFIKFNNENVREFAGNIKKMDISPSGINLTKYQWDISDLLQLIFLFNTMNFCFWAEKDEPKWSVNIGEGPLDGSMALFRLLEENAFQNRVFLNAKFISEISFKEFERLMRGNIEISLLKERYSNLIQSAQILAKRYKGRFIEVYLESDNSAIKLLNIITKNFPAFEDQSTYKGEQVLFYKRAQLQVKMTNDALASFGKAELDGLNSLTAFADYKIPQLLRHFGAIDYDLRLARLVDNQEIIAKDSDEENEIRIATIWGIELLRRELSQRFPDVSASHIDSMLWVKSQHKIDGIKPYHRTYTTAY